jgi:3-oxo-5alpha-steroid 4-dehydrogenase
VTDPADSAATPIGEPLRTDGALAWDEECDVLVVGFGAAGACAAIEAARAGARVIAVDRFGGGGASAKSGGVIYAGGGTRHQKAAGYGDSPEAMHEYLQKEVGDAVSPAALRAFCERSVEMIEWLESLGVEFDAAVPPHKTSYPADGFYLYFSGNETVAAYAGRHPPAPRGHRVKGAGLSGSLLFAALAARAREAGARLDPQSAVRRLVVDGASGAVSGAELWTLDGGSDAARRHQRLDRWTARAGYASSALSDRLRRRVLEVELSGARRRLVRARAGVILSTGGFIFNRSMVAQHAPRYLRHYRIGTSGCDGSGILLGQSVGGRAARLERVSAWRFINPPLAWVQGMVVDGAGRRFCNEEVYGAKLGHEMCEHHDGKAWLILDAAVRREAMAEVLSGKLWAFQRWPALFLMLTAAKRARSLEALARRIGADPEALLDGWRRHRDAARGGVDPLGKSRELLRPLETPPFYALEISAHLSAFPCPAITLGGLCVDEATGAVQREGGAAIDGLFAAGRAAVGIASHHYVSGLALADCIWSGRRAGRAAAARLPSLRTG